MGVTEFAVGMWSLRRRLGSERRVRAGAQIWGQSAGRWHLKIGGGPQGSGEGWGGMGSSPGAPSGARPGQEETPGKGPPKTWEGNQASEASWATWMEKPLGLCAEGPSEESPRGRSQGTCT